MLQAEVEASVQAGIAPAIECVCRADPSPLRRDGYHDWPDRLSIIGAGRDASRKCSAGIDLGEGADP